jgi:hypothetical protein
MNKINYLLIVLIFISNLAISQSLETVMWGDKAELAKKTSFQRIAGVNSDGFYAIRSNSSSHITKDKLWLEYISMTTLNVDESNEIVFPSIGGKQSYYENIFFVNDKLILFTSIEDKSRNQKLLYISYLNTNGTLKNKPKEIGAVPISNFPEDGFELKYLESTKEIMLSYHKSFKQYNGEKYFVKIFDSNLKTNFNEELIFPEEFMERKAEIIQERSVSLKDLKKRIAVTENSIVSLEKKLEQDNKDLIKASQDSNSSQIVKLSKKISENNIKVEILFDELEKISVSYETKKAYFDNQLENL